MMRAARQRLHIDPYYCPPLSDGYDPNSPQSSPSPAFSFSPTTSFASNALCVPMSAAPEWRICHVLCLYDFTSSDADHLNFRKNEILEIVEKEESGWWAALRGDEVGWVPSTFVAELSDEAAEGLKNTREELRVCEYEAEKLFSADSFSSAPRFFDSSFSPVSTHGHDEDNWLPILDPGKKASSTSCTPFMQAMSPSVHVVTDFPDDVEQPLSSISPLHSHPQIDAYSIKAELRSTPNKRSLAPSMDCPSEPTTPLRRPELLPIVNKPTPPSRLCTSPSSASPRSPLNRSRSDSSPSLQHRVSRRRPIMVNDFKSLSRLSAFLGSPHPDSVASDADELHNVFDTVRPPSTPRRSDKVRQLTGDDDAQAFHNAKVAQASLPWYLQPSYSPDDIKLEYNGSVRAATLPALVERLTVDPLQMTQEKMFRDVFLTTFNTFTTADELFDLLVDRCWMECPSSLTHEESVEWSEKKLRPVQKRVLTILTMWVENHGMLQDDPHTVLRLKDFLSRIGSPPTLALSAKLLLQSIDKLATTSTHTCPLPSLPMTPTRRRRHHRTPKNDLSRFDAADVAAQLMLYEHRLYAKIRPRECLLWAKTQESEEVANLTAFCMSYDRIAAWVKSSVLGNDGLGKRADAVDYWIKVAEKCRAINNFSSMSAILAALSSAVISRLHLTWAHVCRTHQFETLSKLNEPSGNFSTYRAVLQGVDGPCVPFIGILLTDMVHIQDQMKDYVSFPLSLRTYKATRPNSPRQPVAAMDSERTCQFSNPPHSGKAFSFSTSPSAMAALPSPRSIASCPASTNTMGHTPPGPPLINFIKRQKWYDVVRTIVRFQSKPLNVVEDPNVMNFINEQLSLASEKLREPSAFWIRSQELQQNELSHADIRRGLEAAGF